MARIPYVAHYIGMERPLGRVVNRAGERLFWNLRRSERRSACPFLRSPWRCDAGTRTLLGRLCIKLAPGDISSGIGVVTWKPLDSRRYQPPKREYDDKGKTVSPRTVEELECAC